MNVCLTLSAFRNQLDHIRTRQLRGCLYGLDIPGHPRQPYEFYSRFICNKENAFNKELKAWETVQNGDRKMIFRLIVHVILFSKLFQLHRILFSRAVYIKT